MPHGLTATSRDACAFFIRGVRISITGPISEVSRLSRTEPVSLRGMPSRLKVTTSADPPGLMPSSLPSQSASRTWQCRAMNIPSARYCSVLFFSSPRRASTETPLRGMTGAAIARANSCSNSARLPGCNPGSKSRRYSSSGMGNAAISCAPCASATRAATRSPPSANPESTMIGVSTSPSRKSRRRPVMTDATACSSNGMS